MNNTCTCTPINRRLTRKCEPCVRAAFAAALDAFAASTERAVAALNRR